MHRFDFDRGKPFPMSFGLVGSGGGAGEKPRSSRRIAHSSSKNHPGKQDFGGIVHRPGAGGPGSQQAEVILVAINGSKALSRHALEWALSNAAQPGDKILLLALLPTSSGWKFWRFTGFKRDSPGKELIRAEEARKACQCMINQLQNLCDAKKVQATVKIVPSAEKGATIGEAKRCHASWVVLDRSLKREEKSCSEQLPCNLVIVDRYNPKILRLNLKQFPRNPSEATTSSAALKGAQLNTPSSSPELPGTPFTPTERGNSTSTSTSPFSSAESYETPGQEEKEAVEQSGDAAAAAAYAESDSDDPTTRGGTRNKSWRNTKDLQLMLLKDHRDTRQLTPVEGKKVSLPGRASSASSQASKQLFPSSSRLSTSMREGGSGSGSSSRPSSSGSGSSKLVFSDILTSLKLAESKSLESKHQEREIKHSESRGKHSKTTFVRRDSPEVHEHASVRKAVSLPLSTHSPPEPPPLCSICQHKAPVFGRPPREFSFRELELVTGGFSQANFLAEGGFGSVHRGILPEGQVVAVKQHKLASSQGDLEFCSEVEVLSCAQHRNVVMLIGYCVENSKRLLVYEFICNSSLDSHLYGRNKDPLEWKYRQKIAIGAARGLRYLHEECRVGCIVHRDMRPNNILLTHDFEPMVGDFGLARWQPDGELGVETRVIGTFGYLAPEYTQSGQITEKADVYSFGIVLLELVTGRKAIDISRPKGQQCLTEWARPLLRKLEYKELVDPRLEDEYEQDEVRFMLHAASLCISRDPSSRPRMSQVLRILEGEMTLDVTPVKSHSGGGDEEAAAGRGAVVISQANYSRRSTSALPSRKNRYMSAFYNSVQQQNQSESLSNSESMPSEKKGEVQVRRKLSLDELKAAYRDKVSSNIASHHRRLSHGDAL